MTKKPTIHRLSAFGELLMDMTPVNTVEGTAFVPNPGGAPCNFLAMASKMGIQSHFYGKVGNDQFGKALSAAAKEAGIHLDGLILDDSVPTTLAFVHLDKTGDRSFSFYRKGCSDVSLRIDEVDMNAFLNSEAVYYGSLALTDEPLKTTAMALIQKAKESECLLCCDPNYRPALWPNEADAVKAMSFCAKQANVIKVSEEELALMMGIQDIEVAAKQLIELGPTLVLVTLGHKGSMAFTQNESAFAPAMSVETIDTTGAGDAFFGTIVSGLLNDGIRTVDQLAILNKGQLEGYLKLANAAAGLCVTKYGAIPALPSREAVIMAASTL